MNDNAQLMTLIWEKMEPLISNNLKEEAAKLLITSFLEKEVELDDLYESEGDCPYLDAALEELREEWTEEDNTDTEWDVY